MCLKIISKQDKDAQCQADALRAGFFEDDLLLIKSYFPILTGKR